MPFDYAVPSVPDGSRIDYSDRLLALGIPFGFFQSALSTDARSSALHSEGRL